MPTGFTPPPARIVQNLNAISVLHPESIGLSVNTYTYAAPVAAAWPTASKSFLIPFQIAQPMTVESFVYGVASASGNLDLGIYNVSGTLLVSTGTTTAAGSGVMTRIGVSPYTLTKPGTYFMAMAVDNTTFTTYRFAGSAIDWQLLGVCAVASNFVLATQTLSASSLTDAAFIPVFGFFTKDLDP